MRKTWLWSLRREDPLEEEMTTHSSVLAWTIPWTEEPGRLHTYSPRGHKESDPTERLKVQYIFYVPNPVPELSWVRVCWDESVVKQFLRWWKRSLLLFSLGAIFKVSFKHFRRRFNDKREDLPVKSLTLMLPNWLSQRHKMNELWGMTTEGLSSPY